MTIFSINPELNKMLEENRVYVINLNITQYLKINKDYKHITLEDILYSNNINTNNLIFDKITESNNIEITIFDCLFYVWCVSIDIISIIVLVFCLTAATINILNKVLPQKLKNYFYFIGVVIYNCLSYYEILSLLSCSTLLIIYSLTGSFVEDDSYDFSLIIILIFVFLLIFIYFKTNGLFKSYYLLTSNSSGERVKRLFLNDLINIFLCLLRIVLCWTRFIFYDLQVEFVDMTTNYTEEINLKLDDSFFDIVLNKIFDLFLVLLSLIICLVKFGISLFLLWLIVDLFILRIGSQVDEMWLFMSIFNIINLEIKKNKHLLK